MASQAQTSDAWISARDRFVEDLNEEEQQRYFKASPESLLGDASAAEKLHGTKSTTRGVMEKLQSFVAAVEQYGTAIDIYSNTYSLALGPIWGSIKVLLHIAREFGKYFDKLVEMFARIGDVLPRFRTYERLFSNHERLIQALSVAYLDIITFCTNAKTVFRRGNKATFQFAFKLLWKPFDLQFGKQLSAFREHQKNVEKEAGLANMIEAADARAMVLADQKQLEKRRKEDNRLRIFAMLHAVDYEAKHRKLQNLRHAGTGEWLFKQAAYVEWKTSDSSAFLCCHGIPGCGKSIIASNLVDKLTSYVTAPAAVASDVIYYYCDYADQRTLQLDRILGSLLRQLFTNHQIPEHIESQLLQMYAGGTRSPPENALGNVFCTNVALRSDIFIIFDGLDECEKTVWQEILKLFKQLAEIQQSAVKIFITCVEEGPVAHRLTASAHVQLSPRATAEDIRAFVESSVASKIEYGDLKISNPRLEQDIISELVSKANGLFLWVYFQLDDLCNSSSDAMIRETLKNLPEGLGDTYKRILTKISKSPSRALARKVFIWATVAKRPLHVEELREAVAIEPDEKSWNEDSIPHEDLMFECCRGLIIKDDDETAHFAHHTVQQYLTGGLAIKVDPFFQISVVNADILAGQTCVAYLSFSDFETQITSSTPTVTPEHKGVLESGGPLWIPSILGIRRPMFDIPYRLLRGDPAMRPSGSDYWKHLRPKPKQKQNPSPDVKDKYRLLSYAIDYWEPHSRSYQLSDSVFPRRLENLAKHKTLAFDFRPWGSNQHFGSYGCVGCPSPSAVNLVAKDLPHMSMIHYAAEVGNLPLLTSHYSSEIEIGDYIYHERYHHETLLIACRHNRIKIVRYLMNRYDSSEVGERAIIAAAAAGHAEVVHYLISLRQYPVKQIGDVPLLLAAKNGHDAVVGVLAEAGANTNAYDQHTGRSIVESAAMNGHDSVIRILTRRGAQQFLDRNIGTKALRLAAANGHATVTRVLLESRLSNDETGLSHHLALHEAAKSGHSAVAEILLEYGADPSFEPVQAGIHADSYQETPFNLAAKSGHVRVLELFRKYVPSVDVPRRLTSTTALHYAAIGGHEQAIRWLVANGADVNAMDHSGKTPLHFATARGEKTAVNVLLQLGAMVVHTKALYGATLVLSKPTNGDTVILELLLKNLRKDPRISDNSKHEAILSALEQARKEKSVEFVEMLEREQKLYPEEFR